MPPSGTSRPAPDDQKGPGERNASFVKLREKNAFLVSSARSGNRVSYVDVTSEVGKQVQLQNPWPGQTISVTRVGGGSVAFTLPTT